LSGPYKKNYSGIYGTLLFEKDATSEDFDLKFFIDFILLKYENGQDAVSLFI
jgi:hypothetical protein